MSKEPWLPVAKLTASAIRWAKNKQKNLDAEPYDLYQDTAVLPIETIGYCQGTKTVREFFHVPREKLLLDIILDDLVFFFQREGHRKKENKKIKRITVTRYISHMLLDDDDNIIKSFVKPITLANGYCSVCWDVGYGGHLPPNLTQPVGEIRW